MKKNIGLMLLIGGISLIGISVYLDVFILSNIKSLTSIDHYVLLMNCVYKSGTICCFGGLGMLICCVYKKINK